MSTSILPYLGNSGYSAEYLRDQFYRERGPDAVDLTGQLYLRSGPVSYSPNELRAFEQKALEQRASLEAAVKNTSPFGTANTRQGLFQTPTISPYSNFSPSPTGGVSFTPAFPAQVSQPSFQNTLNNPNFGTSFNPLEDLRRSMFNSSMGNSAFPQTNLSQGSGFGGGSGGGGGNSSAIPLEGKIGIVKLAQGGDAAMKNDILERAMFAMPLSKEARNTGILSGFEDEMEDEGSYEEDEALDLPRTPQNPEILMNNLRGDMRSVDARYMELAQMVGEEAAMQTPPEVLAMLQTQLAQQAGIGALPQAQGMAPPPMEAPMGGPPLPFPQGGAEQAPPTPDGLPPLRAAAGTLVSAGQRLAQMGATGAQNLNQYLGNLLMRPQFGVERMTGGSPPMALSLQARNALVQGPSGEIAFGTGTRMAPAGTLSLPASPTFTEGLRTGIQQGAQRLAERFPTAAQAMEDIRPYLGKIVGDSTALGGLLGMGAFIATREERQRLADEAARANAEREVLLSRIPGQRPPMPPPPPGGATGAAGEPFRVDVSGVGTPIPEPSATAATMTPQERLAFEEANIPGPAGRGDLTPESLTKLLAGAGAQAAPSGRGERIKAGYQELAPIFKELLGDDKETARANALLLLAQAGFKLGTSRQPTAAMAISEAAAELPRGFAAILAQAQDRDIKIRTAALQQAIGDVQQQDKEAMALKLQLIKGDFDLMKEQLKRTSNQVLEDAGAGGRLLKTDKGSFLGFSIDPQDPTVRSAIRSSFTLRDTDNPFVENRGQAPTSVETDKGQRIKLSSTLNSLDDSLTTLSNLKGRFAELYSPGTWFQDKVNNILVPISGGLIRPDVKQESAATEVQVGLNSIMKNIASANDGGRVAVQEQEWVRETAKGINNPTQFFSNKEIAAQQFNTLETVLRNARQRVLTQLGYEGNDYVMRTPNTGTQSDPFVIPADPAQRKMMYTFLGSTIGKLQDPRATVYLRDPNGVVKRFTPPELLKLMRTE